MNDQEINIAIAEACGWTSVFKHGFPGLVTGVPSKGYPIHRDPFPTDCGLTIYELPRYSTDLNAMNQAETALEGLNKATFAVHLCKVVEKEWHPGAIGSGSFAHVHASARQRAEAFLRTIGKWKEGE